MTSPLLACPVRVLIRTRLGDSQQIDPSIKRADEEFIAQLCIKLSSSIDKTAIHHLITRQSDSTMQSDRSGYVDIVFDHNLAENVEQPEVRGFKVRIRHSVWKIEELHNPSIKSAVNKTVKAWKEINLKHGLSFPSRGDIRSETRLKQEVVDSR
jgi:hypothetical protein